MHKIYHSILYLALACFTVSCNLVNNGGSGNSSVTSEVYVWNQGAFGQGNASVTGYNPVTNTATQNIFATRNNRPIGDTIESATLVSGKLYIVVDGSNKIEVVDPSSMMETGSIGFQGSVSPWQLVAAGQNTAYVTEFYKKSVAVVDLNSLKVTSTITVGTYPEGIATANGKAYVAVSGLGRSDSVAVINMAANTISGYIKVGDNPTVVAADAEGRIWVVCTGNYGYDANGNYNSSLETFGKVNIINSSNDNVVNTIDVGGHPGGITLLDKESKAYVNNSGIQVIDMQQLTLIPGKLLNRTFYSIAIDPNSNKPVLYGSVVTDYTSAGHVVLYNLDTTLPTVVDSFKTGINPGAFSFIAK